MNRLYAVRDSKMGVCNAPCMFENDAVATRAFGDMVAKDRESLIGIHPEDFTLLYLGDYDREKGVIVPSDCGPLVLCVASDFVKAR